jgi:hypothetical protein
MARQNRINRAASVAPSLPNLTRWASHLASANGLAQRSELNPQVDFWGVGSEWRFVRGDAPDPKADCGYVQY